MSVLRVGQVYRRATKKDSSHPELDGLPNFHYVTHSPNCKPVRFAAGINPIACVGERRPAVLILSTPHKAGSQQTPWQDVFDADNGHIRYYGDNKEGDVDPAGNVGAKAQGNKELLRQFELHTSGSLEQRMAAAPLIFFRSSVKGHHEFHGFGLVERAERVTQYNQATGKYFSNYLFDFLVLDLSDQNEQFNWSWIGARRDQSKSTEETNEVAPRAWRTWLEHGMQQKDRIRRNVHRLLVVPKDEQLPRVGTRERKALEEVYTFYSTEHHRKGRFEALAFDVVQRLLLRNGTEYVKGWITPASTDHGVDFVGRIDLGTGFSKAKLVVLGQAKCEKIGHPTGGNHVARTVARLKRGWVGAYVTTSFFSPQVQQEILADKWPLLLVHGGDLAAEVMRATQDSGFGSVNSYLSKIDSEYEGWIARREAEEILHR